MPRFQRSLADYYSRVANPYFDLWEPILRPRGEELVKDVAFASGSTILDVATGTGGLLPFLRGAAPGARVIGVDLSPGMLRIARATGTRVAAMDMAQLGVRGGCVDVVVSAFALFHCPDPGRALVDFRRVLRPDGLVAIATWGESLFPGSAIWTEELDAVGAAPDPLTEDNQGLMDSPAKLEGLLVDAGLSPRRVWTRSLRHPWTPRDLVACRSRCGGDGRRLATVPPAGRDLCLARVRSRLEELAPEERVQTAEIVFGWAGKDLPGDPIP